LKFVRELRLGRRRHDEVRIDLRVHDREAEPDLAERHDVRVVRVLVAEEVEVERVDVDVAQVGARLADRGRC
jgi:hypothetical protein